MHYVKLRRAAGIVGVIGANGAGKSTLFKMIVGQVGVNVPLLTMEP